MSESSISAIKGMCVAILLLQALIAVLAGRAWREEGGTVTCEADTYSTPEWAKDLKMAVDVASGNAEEAERAAVRAEAAAKERTAGAY